MTEPTATAPHPDSVPEVCVVYLLRRDEEGRRLVALGRKRTGLGRGRIVAPGGKLEPGETPEQAAVREVREEVGVEIDVAALSLRGSLLYEFPARPTWTQRSWVFVATSWRGALTGSAELVADWVLVEDVDYASMWSDAGWWLPSVLDGGSVDARFTFGDDLKSVVDADHPAWIRTRPSR